MFFHPEKCKVVSIVSNANRLTHINLLPFSKLSYILGSTVLLNYEENKVDLGVIINDKFTSSDHQNKIILNFLNYFFKNFILFLKVCSTT